MLAFLDCHCDVTRVKYNTQLLQKQQLVSQSKYAAITQNAFVVWYSLSKPIFLLVRQNFLQCIQHKMCQKTILG